MSLVLLYGTGSGALHAVTGPDHLLSLGPTAMSSRAKGASYRLGLAWGAGHAIGTLLLAIPFLLVARSLHMPTIAAIGDRLAGVALIVLGILSLRAAQRGEHAQHSTRAPLTVGLIHGVTGAGSLLLLVPMLASGELARSVAFLIAFAAGSTIAMAALTELLARVGARVGDAFVRRARKPLVLASIGLGVVWLAIG